MSDMNVIRLFPREGSDGFRIALPVPPALQGLPSAGYLHVVSVSGGKDSLATLLKAITRFGRERVLAIFCDTGNEHEWVYDYLAYLEQALEIKIHRLVADFREQILRKRMFIARDQRSRRQYDRVPVMRGGAPVLRMASNGLPMLEPIWRKNGEFDLAGIPKQRKAHGKRVRWTNKAKRRALAALHPTGNPFLDLCLWKGRFPSRKGQFCTQELKRDMAVDFQLDLIERGYTVISWQGVRRDESIARQHAKQCERIGGGLWIYRPIVTWTAQQVFAYCAEQGIAPNPLYMHGMTRVGCMPCINASKDELRQISQRFPEHIERIADWERQVRAASKRGGASFIPAPTGGAKVLNNVLHAEENNIYAVVRWSKTTHGGRQFSLLDDLDELAACSSAYGLCE